MRSLRNQTQPNEQQRNLETTKNQVYDNRNAEDQMDFKTKHSLRMSTCETLKLSAIMTQQGWKKKIPDSQATGLRLVHNVVDSMP